MPTARRICLNTMFLSPITAKTFKDVCAVHTVIMSYSICYLFTLHFCQLRSLSPHEVAALLRDFRHCGLAYVTTFLCVFPGIILHCLAVLQKFPIYYCFPSLPCLFLLLPFYLPSLSPYSLWPVLLQSFCLDSCLYLSNPNHH